MARQWFQILGVVSVVLLGQAARAQQAPSPAASSTASASPASPASPAPDGDKKLAVEWANKAKERFDAGDYQGAIDAIHEAEKHVRPPTFTRLAAQAYDKLGNLLEAQRLYQSIVDTALDASAPAAWTTAKEESKKDVSALGPRIPTIKVTLLGAAATGLVVTLDGAPFDLGRLGQVVQQNPGKHVLVVDSKGRIERREVTLKERDQQDVTVQFPPEAPVPTSTAIPVAPTAAPVVSSAPTASATGPAPTGKTPAPSATAASSAAPQRGSGPPAQTYVAYGFGLAGLIAGGVLGGLTLAKQSEFEKNHDADVGQEGATLSAATDLALMLGVMSVVSGTVMWARGPGVGEPAKAASARTVVVSPGAGGLSIRGTF